ncbi:MAG TPA: hypothetical protein VIL23_00540 [Clostridia bacterium]
MSENIAEEITQGDSTPKVSFGAAIVNFLYGITFAANLKVMVLRLILYIGLLVGIAMSIVTSVMLESVLIFFDDFIHLILAGIGLFALTEIINRRKT